MMYLAAGMSMLIALVALIILGKALPEIARRVGTVIGYLIYGPQIAARATREVSAEHRECQRQLAARAALVMPLGVVNSWDLPRGFSGAPAPYRYRALDADFSVRYGVRNGAMTKPVLVGIRNGIAINEPLTADNWSEVQQQAFAILKARGLQT